MKKKTVPVKKLKIMKISYKKSNPKFNLVFRFLQKYETPIIPAEIKVEPSITATKYKYAILFIEELNLFIFTTIKNKTIIAAPNTIHTLDPIAKNNLDFLN